jgi:hypothetical protein
MLHLDRLEVGLHLSYGLNIGWKKVTVDGAQWNRQPRTPKPNSGK